MHLEPTDLFVALMARLGEVVPVRGVPVRLLFPEPAVVARVVTALFGG